MATASTIPVRLPQELLSPLDAWAKELGLSRSAAIKLCVAKQIGAVEKADAAALAALDGRKYRYTRPGDPAGLIAGAEVKAQSVAKRAKGTRTKAA